MLKKNSPLEDVIIVTEKGAEIITDYISMDIDNIEKLMNEEGISQKYPKDTVK